MALPPPCSSRRLAISAPGAFLSRPSWNLIVPIPAREAKNLSKFPLSAGGRNLPMTSEQGRGPASSHQAKSHFSADFIVAPGLLRRRGIVHAARGVLSSGVSLSRGTDVASNGSGSEVRGTR
jgi:hypothetical protein